MDGAAEGGVDGGVGAAEGGTAATEGDEAGDGVEASVDRRRIRSFRNDHTDDIAVSVRARRLAAPSKYPETCWATVTAPRPA